MRDGRQCYVHVARGSLHVAGLHLEAGDGLKITDPGEIDIREGQGAEVLVFDLAEVRPPAGAHLPNGGWSAGCGS